MTRPISLLLSALLFTTILGCASTPTQAQGGRLLGIGNKAIGGGALTWSDEVIYNGWRIQKHAVIGHYRLLDPKGYKVAIGSFENCEEKFYEARRDQAIPELPKHVVIVIHGLGATRNYMQGLADELTEKGNFATVNVGYPSTMGKIEDHSDSLASVIRHLEGVETIDFVAHSMGNIVTRHYLYDLSQLPEDQRPKVKFRRMVMISPPNHGAGMANKWAGNKLAQMFAGEPLNQLAPDLGWPELEKQLVTPDFEFGVLAGGKGDEEGYLASIPGDDDALLSVETMKLAGANDFIQVKGIHQLMAKYKSVRENTLNYLQNGYFHTAETRQPIN
ncbi:esterase/lipase family protein [Adhaeretor mobilis]|uniref:Alpha/beta hydrolase family protein n=1 Tax=Adhaeretor mobilis TaxID=1930276 RepID=A0A517MYW6_9BACT|nr:alpha/beta hydrolase [Adhaeretor mobilis]QDT00081.1 Alpha/beta hydrolase family protein [Adhaeretor mobilis]